MREQDRPFFENVTGFCFAALVLAAIIIGLCGCEQGFDRPSSDPDLLAVAETQNARLAAAFDCPPLPDYTIYWGPVGGGSCAYLARSEIVIDGKYAGGGVSRVVAHEVFHVMSGIRDHDVETWRGVRIKDHVAWGNP